MTVALLLPWKAARLLLLLYGLQLAAWGGSYSRTGLCQLLHPAAARLLTCYCRSMLLLQAV